MQTLRLVHFKAALLGLPGIDRVLGHSVLSGYILGCATCLDLLQRNNDLRLRVPALAHTLSSIRNHTAVCAEIGEQVSTRIKGCFHPLQSRRNLIQNNRSEAAKCGCGCLCLNISSCCRSVRFSKSRSRRERKKRVGKVNARISRRNMRPVFHKSGKRRCAVELLIKTASLFGRPPIKKDCCASIYLLSETQTAKFTC
jgi:hypothetical protein